ncbi:HEPN domain-containing protein [Pseudomonas syringae pv. syringae]|uniref:HEPN domain-containing protein n=1 Tax=Pseudomonas syringae TaxID=317 RepID=UPI003B00800F
MAFKAIDAATSCIDRSRQLLTASKVPANAGIEKDLLRSALVMAVSAMDSYMHWMVFQQITAVSKNSGLPKALAKLEIPFSDVADLAEAMLKGRRAGIETRPWNALKNSAQKQLLFKTFQSFEQVSMAMSMSGILNGWKSAAAVLSINVKDIKSRLNHIVHRRNQIVHEGDITRSSLPRNLKFNSLDSAEISGDVDWVESLILAIESIR